MDAESSFVEVETEIGALGAHDLLVEVRAVSVNPVDVKVRASVSAQDTPKVLGFDASGVVVATGAAVTAFSAGDEVYYAGSVARGGSNTDHHLVDERVTGHKPSSLDFAEAAAPHTAHRGSRPSSTARETGPADRHTTPRVGEAVRALRPSVLSGPDRRVRLDDLTGAPWNASSRTVPEVPPSRPAHTPFRPDV